MASHHEELEVPECDNIQSFGSDADNIIFRSPWEDAVEEGRCLPVSLLAEAGSGCQQAMPGAAEWTRATSDAHAANHNDVASALPGSKVEDTPCPDHASHPAGPIEVDPGEFAAFCGQFMCEQYPLWVHGPQMEPLPREPLETEPFATAELGLPAHLCLDGEEGARAEERAADDGQGQVPDGERTTIMLRHIPNNYTRDHVEELLNEQGFGGEFDFVYLPYDFTRKAGYGYAFINFRTNEQARRATAAIQGFSQWKMASEKTAAVDWATHQGRECNIQRFRNSSVMHPEVHDAYKPVCYDEDGNPDAGPLEPGRELRR
eukprot:CAMPEP_0179221472 /NCGR_PEP_ID=MMETSP0797-20121207/6210_1 /TAXON_ID=47934 /ORGANISM="Dinophysis acuminata, Strain DAEP01" /LENGTH=317 /DNA_ID=CAMNT_0020928259 /DNA_START=22 /DNA_END=973 /DNA_ORIENTATION=-